MKVILRKRAAETCEVSKVLPNKKCGVDLIESNESIIWAMADSQPRRHQWPFSVELSWA